MSTMSNILIACLVILSFVFGVLYFTKKCTPDCTKCTPDCTECTPDCTKCTPDLWKTLNNMAIDPSSTNTVPVNVGTMTSDQIRCMLIERNYDMISFGGKGSALMCKGSGCKLIQSNTGQTYIYSGAKCKNIN